MTIANQRLIFNLVKEGSISGISPLQVEFEYGDTIHWKEKQR